MEEIVFNPSKKPTVGIEIEAQLVDKDSGNLVNICLLYTSPSPRDVEESRMPSSA